MHFVFLVWQTLVYRIKLLLQVLHQKLHFESFAHRIFMLEIPVIDLKLYKATGSKTECDKAAESLQKFGVVCVRDEVAMVTAGQRVESNAVHGL